MAKGQGIKYKTTIDFKKYCNLVKKYVLKEEDLDELHQQYVDWKNARKNYLYSATEWIINIYSERTLDKHKNCLKRNKDKTFESKLLLNK
jgi:hypothetical protein